MIRGLIVCDACVVLNLVATGREVDLLRAVGARIVMAPKARGETRSLKGPRDKGGQPTLIPADLRPLEKEGLLEVRAVGLADAALLVKYGALLKDADAECAALAEAGGLQLATDDAKPRRVVAELRGDTALLSSLELVREAAAHLKLGVAETRALLKDVFEKGGFAPPRPGKSLPLGGWYRQHLEALGLLG